MRQPNSDLLLHPIRMRILIAIAGRELTVQQLAEHLTDVPQATLYRHVKVLADNQLLVVSHEKPVRGTLERTYRLNEAVHSFRASSFEAASAQDHMRYFLMFISSLLADFARYRKRSEHAGTLDVVKDGVSYSTAPLNLTDEEFRRLQMALYAAVAPFLNNPATPDRQRRLFTSIVIPDAEES